jgi:hypothetical protein
MFSVVVVVGGFWGSVVGGGGVVGAQTSPLYATVYTHQWVPANNTVTFHLTITITCNRYGCHPVQLFTVVLYNSMISVNTTLIYIPNYSDKPFHPNKDHYQALAEKLYINGTVRNSTIQYSML